jgi:UPF0755 protein
MNVKLRKWFKLTGLLVLLLGSATAYHVYQSWFASIIDEDFDGKALFVPTGSNAQDVLAMLTDLGLVHGNEFGANLMDIKNYKGSNVEPGMYELKEGTSLNALINNLRGGHGESTVRITFQTERTLSELSEKVARNIEADSAAISRYLNDPATAQRFGFKPLTFLAMFLPDTYFAHWDTDPEAFVERMATEYKLFWTDERREQAQALGLTQSEVATLASVVQAEQQLHPAERPVIAGLYLNRLKQGMRLQSDPTVVYAIGDFNINRVLTMHLAYKSPYNTYLYPGLPPGPINIPQKLSVDAVLRAESNDYLFMCAKADFSGYHAFAKDLATHNRNAAAYRKALNDKKIYK